MSLKKVGFGAGVLTLASLMGLAFGSEPQLAEKVESVEIDKTIAEVVEVKEPARDKYVGVDFNDLAKIKAEKDQAVIEYRANLRAEVIKTEVKTAEKDTVQLAELSETPIEEVAEKRSEDLVAIEIIEVSKTQEPVAIGNQANTEEVKEETQNSLIEVEKLEVVEAEEFQIADDEASISEEIIAQELPIEEVDVEIALVEEELIEEVASLHIGSGQAVSLSGRVTHDLNVRNAAGAENEVIGVLPTGIEISGELEEGWIKIYYNGEYGYISEDFVTTTEDILPEEILEEPVIEEIQEVLVEEIVEEVSFTSGQAIVDSAMKYLGYPYVYAQASPSTGFDCSGFTSYIFSNYAGVSLNRHSAAQAENGYSVSVDSMQAGDLLLFDGGSGYIDHVGIYAGGGQYIHASTPERGVVLDSTSGNYFQNSLVGVRRIVN